MVEINKLEQVEKEDFLPLEPKPEHIDYLLANPSTASQFDAKYGEGASLKYLPTQKQEENLQEQKDEVQEIPPEKRDVSVTEDVLKSAGAGVQEGVKETLETFEQISDDLESKFGLGGFVFGADAENGIAQYLGPEEFKAKTDEINAREGADKGFFQSLADLIPKSREAETTAGGVTKSVTQFLTGFAGAKKITSGVAGYNKLNKFVRSTIEGAIADFTVFDEHEARLSDFVIEVVPDAEESFFGYLASDENDTFYEGKLKNALEGGMLGTVADGTFRLIKYAKDMRKLKKEKNLTEAQKEAKKLRDELYKDLANVDEQQLDYISKVNRGIPVELKAPVGRPSREKIDELVKDSTYVKTIKENMKKVRLGEMSSDEAFDIPLNIKRLDGGEAINDISDVIAVTKAVFDNAKSIKEVVDDVQTFDDIMKESEDLIEKPIETLQRANTLGEQIMKDAPIMQNSLAVIYKGLARQYLNTAKKYEGGLVSQKEVDNNLDLVVKTGELLKQFKKGGGRLLNANNIVVKQESQSIKELNKLIEKNRFRITPEERAILHKKVATVEKPRKVLKFIKDVATLRAFGLDKINEYWINALLSNPKTHAINMTSNLLVAITRPLEQMVGSGFGLIDRKAFIESASTLAGLIKYFRLSLRASMEAARRGDSILDKGLNKVDLPEQSIGGKTGSFIRIPTKLLQAEDEFFKQINYHAKAYSMAVSDGLSKNLSRKKNIRLPNGKMVSELDEHVEDFMDSAFKPSGEGRIPEALEYAQTNTFTKDLGADTVGGGYQKIVNGFPLLRQITPFVRTPVNIFRYAMDRSPLGFVRKNMRERLKDPATRSQARGELLLGNSIIIGMITLADSEQITGGYNPNPIIRRQQMDSGWQPYSIKWNDKYISYERLDPFAMIIGITADYNQLYAEATEDERNQLAEGIQLTLYNQIISTAGNVGDVLLTGSLGASKNLTSKTYLKGLSDFIEVLDSGELREAERFLRNKVGSFTPSIITNFINDPVYRETKSIADTIKTRLGSTSVDPSFNVMGEVRTREASFLERFLIPTTISQDKGDVVLNEFNRLGVGFTPIRDTMGSNSNVQLSSYTNEKGITAYRRYNELIGTVKVKGLTLRQALEKEIKSDKYQTKLTDNITDEDFSYKGSKQDKINKIIKAYRMKAKKLLMKENFTSENGLMLKKAIINDKKNVVFNKKGKDLLDIE